MGQKSTIKTIVVLGMHRSGTSMLGSILHNMGVKMGSSKDVEKNEFDNILGFFENYEVAIHNDELLDLMGGAWDKSPQKDLAELDKDKLNELKRQAKDILDKLYKQGNVVGIKEPRMSILLDYWEEFLQNPQYIFIFRNPLDVAKSLEKRNGFEIDKGLSLWTEYNERTLKFLKDKEYLMLRYEDLLSDPATFTAEIFKFLQMEFDDKKLQISTKEVESAIQHHQTKDGDFLNDKNARLSAKEVFKTMLDLYNKQNKTRKVKKIQIAVDKDLMIKHSRAKLIKMEGLIGRYRGNLKETIAKVDELEETVKEQNKVVDNVNRRNEKANSRIRLLEGQLLRIRTSFPYKFYRFYRRIIK